MPISFALFLGLALGLRHALDADHLVAIGTLVPREHRLRGALRTGALWGLGHLVTILGLGVAIVAFGVHLDERVNWALEMLVALMLIALGCSSLRRGHERRQARVGAWRPVLVGVVHGLAGSASLALLALATIRQPVVALAYLALFGVGTVVGMAGVTVVLSLSLSRVGAAVAGAERAFLIAASVGSIVLGFGLLVRLVC